jgi:hypothetical protein
MSSTSRIPGPRPTAPVAHANGGVPGSTRKVGSDRHDPAVARRLDALDARIWAAARPLDDPQLAVGAARDFAREVFVALILRAGDGRHRVNCSVASPDGPVSAPADLPMSIMIAIPAVSLPRGGVDDEIRELLALAFVTGSPAVLILRTLEDGEAQASADRDRAAGAEDYTVRGWRIAAGRSEPMDAAGMFAFCCSEASSGEPLPIHPGTRYADALPLPSVAPPGA